MAPFCMGTGITMGTDGLKWAGNDPEDDCVMLWTQAFGVTSVGRAVIASVVVFLMALLAQYLTTRSGNKIQEAKEFAKKKRTAAVVLSSQHYDSEQGRGSTNGRGSNGTNGSNGNGTAPPGLKASAIGTLQQQIGPNANSAVPAMVASVSISSRSIPAPAAVRTTMAIPAAHLFSNNGNSVPIRAADTLKVSDYEHFCDSLQHGLRIFIAYLLMLAAMTYDVTLIVSIVLGFTVGYFVFTNDTSKVPISADPCCS